MLAGILITIREGLEAFLVIGILLGYLRKIKRSDAAGQIWAGAAVALGLSVVMAVGFKYLTIELEGAAQEIFEAVVTAAAVAVLTWMVIWMQRQSRYIKGELEEKLSQAVSSQSILALASLAFFAVFREGMETVLILYGVARSADRGLIIGAVIGLAAAGVIAYTIFNTSVRLNLRRFFIVTGTLLIFIAAGMVSQVVHALTEAHLIPSMLAVTVWNSSHIISDNGIVGKLLHVFVGYSARPNRLQLAAYLIYLAVVGSYFYRAVAETAPRPRPVTAEGRAAAVKSK